MNSLNWQFSFLCSVGEREGEKERAQKEGVVECEGVRLSEGVCVLLFSAKP